MEGIRVRSLAGIVLPTARARPGGRDERCSARMSKALPGAACPRCVSVALRMSGGMDIVVCFGGLVNDVGWVMAVKAVGSESKQEAN